MLINLGDFVVFVAVYVMFKKRAGVFYRFLTR